MEGAMSTSDLAEFIDRYHAALAAFFVADLAYSFEIERVRARMGSSSEPAAVALRVTTTLRREQEGWLIAHKHADPITGSRPPESVIER
jgi:ketosteroid isomerase-like protein